ncbi:hypothetical protein RCO27_17325 [Sphingosinicella sp. LHD-64]|uniref:DUF6624 domain-containing protein n=1 Tax=Sphingosinicella sp. LHD-64 TaxID=3072139 RepID=UPI0028108DA2|nr:DUF6624 domain-containing protein [Sphingosinicella sp. LHD-64]MDQ8757990.1 hypothetical protein [Sphingosinicella sp. LHD-64]
MDEGLREQLLAMARHDLDVRTRLADDGSLFEGYHPEMQAVHDANATALDAIIAERGWPSVALAGTDGEEAAWLVAQHAIGQPGFQRRCLALLEAAAARDEAPGWQPAYLADRIRSLEGRPQLYGTQFDWDEKGLMSPLPIEAPDEVDARRAAIGLAPLAETTAKHRRNAAAETRPADLARRKREMHEWAVRTGWRSPAAP